MFNNKRNQINPRSCTLKFPGDKFLSQYDRFGVSIIKDKVPYFDADIADANVSKYFEYKINLLAKNSADGNNSI